MGTTRSLTRCRLVMYKSFELNHAIELMFGLLIEYLALTGINTITLRVNAEPGLRKVKIRPGENITPIIVTHS